MKSFVAKPAVSKIAGENLARAKSRSFPFSQASFTSALILGILTPTAAHACACGCGIFDVGTSSMLPEGPGGMAYVEYDYQNQYINWSGNSRAPSANNSDKRIDTSFITAGVQYFFNRNWGFQVDVPYNQRTFKTESADPTAPPGSISTINWGDLGDIRLRGIYTGFSEDLSTGISFGLKLPTGNYTHNDAFGEIDRDTELGTGSTDLLLGAFHRQKFTLNAPFTWFAQAQFELPLLIQDDYRPGWEADAALGIYYKGWSIGRLQITPVAQVLGSVRGSDSGENSSGQSGDPGNVNSGYRRLLLSPGIEFHIHPISIYADVEIPLFQQETGDQLTAPALFKLVMEYHF